MATVQHFWFSLGSSCTRPGRLKGSWIHRLDRVNCAHNYHILYNETICAHHLHSSLMYQQSMEVVHLPKWDSLQNTRKLHQCQLGQEPGFQREKVICSMYWFGYHEIKQILNYCSSPFSDLQHSKVIQEWWEILWWLVSFAWHTVNQLLLFATGGMQQ